MRLLYLALGHVSMVLAFLGLFLPILPCTPFVLLGAFFYSRSSDALHRWILDHPRFGILVRDWQAHGAIRPQAKMAAAFLITAATLGSVMHRTTPLALDIAVVIVTSGVLAFILSRPAPPESP